MPGSVTDEALRDSAATSVIGNPTGSVDSPQDVAASVDDTVLARQGGTLDWVASNLFGPGGSRYHPDRTPVVCNMDEEFPGAAESLTWSWGNQGSAAIAYLPGMAYLTTDTTTGVQRRCRWITPPSGQNFMAVMKFYQVSATVSLGLSGMALIETGSIATPTLIIMSVVNAGSNGIIQGLSATSYTAAYAGIGGSQSWGSGAVYARPNYALMTYNDTTKVTNWYYSYSGFFGQIGGTSATQLLFTRTLGAAPVALGFFADNNSGATAMSGMTMWVEYFRVFTDGVHNAAPYLIGADGSGN